MSAPILQQLDALRAVNCKTPKGSRVQPNHEEQTALIVRNMARKFVKTTLSYECDILYEKLLTGDRRILGQPKIKFDRPVTAPTPSFSSTNQQNSNTQHTNHERRPFTAQETGSSNRLEGTNNDSTILEHSRSSDAILEKSHPKLIFRSMISSISRSKSVRVYREMKPIDVIVDKNIDGIREDSKNSIKRRRTGMAIVLDPCLNTGGHTITLRVTYEIPSTELTMVIVPSLHDKPPEPVKRTVTFDIRSDGKTHGLQLTSTPNQLSLQSRHIQLHGWDGILPIFIPYHSASCELIHVDDAPLTSISMIAFPALGPRQALKTLSQFHNDFNRMKIANSTIHGGIPELIIAAWNGDIKSVEYYLLQGADPNTRSPETKSTALHEATSGGHESIVNLLIDNNANQTIVDDSGNTPLHIACKLGNITIARVLMKANGGKKALTMANKKGLRPVELCANRFMAQRVEEIMRAYMIVIKQRVSVSAGR